MASRTFPPHAPRITFTHDFHELLRGDLAPGRAVTLRYDPLRIARNDPGYVFGDPARPIVVHALFRPGDTPVSRTLVSRSGRLEHPDVDPTGNGDMLEAEIAVPEDAREVELWFSYASPDRGMFYDNDNGANFHFGFPRRQVRVLAADVGSDAQSGAFSLRVAAIPEVERMRVRLRSVNHEDYDKIEADLQRTQESDNGWSVWTLSAFAVPRDAVIQYKLYYWLNARRYKEDNDGLYYLAPEPPAAPVPPPPPELAAAARQWS